MQRVTYRKEILNREIDEIAGAVSSNFTEEVKANAIKIALDFFNENLNADPDTVARAAFYIALKEYKCDAEKSAKTLVTNGGKKNAWWLYIVPIVERHMKRK